MFPLPLNATWAIGSIGPLLSIRRVDCAQRHTKVTGKNGKYAANRVFSFLRTIYRRMHKTYDAFPPSHPVVGVDFNTEARSQELPIENLAEWWQQIAADQPHSA